MGLVTPLSVMMDVVAPPRCVPLLLTLACRVLSLVGRLTRSLLPLRAAAGGRGAVLELFSGCGRLTGACSSLGLGVFVPFEIKNGSEFDLIDKRVQSVILKWILTRRVWLFTLALSALAFQSPPPLNLIPACVSCLWSAPASRFV